VKILFWLSLIGVLYTYAGYPVLIWLLARLRPWPTKSARITPSVSIVLAVHNGAALLPAKIQHLLAVDYPSIKEIILVSDGSTDATADLLRAQSHPKIQFIILKEHGGKAVAVNAGMARATADILLFVDIRPEIAPGAIQELVGNFADPKVGCVAGELNLRQEGHDATSSAVGGLYWRYEQWIRTCESTFDSPVGVYGGFYAIRRDLATLQPAGMILDDMFQPLSIIRQGYRSVVDLKACVHDIWPKQVSGEFHRKVRTLAGNFQLIQLAPWTLSFHNRVLFQLVSHKLMRLAAPYLLVSLLVSAWALSLHSPLSMGLAIVQTFSFLLAILGLRFKLPVLHRLAAPASALLVLNGAAVVGLYKFLTTRGPLWKIWNAGPPQPMGHGPESAVLAESVAPSTASVAGNPLRNDSNQRTGLEAPIVAQAKWQPAPKTVSVPLAKRPTR
jgi:cellulose synthase/poly-beta-1,6-N-acetylglucosamine synthase-like glycosyltransferase